MISTHFGQSCLTAEVRRGHSIYTRHKNSKWSFYHHVRNSHVNIYKVKIISINREVRKNAQSKLRNFNFAKLSMYIKVHIMQLDHIRFAKSSFYFWPIIHFSVFPAQFWIFSEWCLVLSLGTLFTEIRQILAKFIFF